MLSVEVKGTDKNGPVGFGLPRQIFLACYVLNHFSVCSEDLELTLAAAKVIVERLAADFASHARLGVLTPKNNDSAVKNPMLVRFRKFEFTTAGRLVGVVSFVGFGLINYQRADVYRACSCW